MRHAWCNSLGPYRLQPSASVRHQSKVNRFRHETTGPFLSNPRWRPLAFCGRVSCTYKRDRLRPFSLRASRLPASIHPMCTSNFTRTRTEVDFTHWRQNNFLFLHKLLVFGHGTCGMIPKRPFCGPTSCSCLQHVDELSGMKLTAPIDTLMQVGVN